MNWQHFRSILWLRWCLSRNQMSRGGAINGILSIFFLFGLVMATLVGGLGGMVGGFVGLSPAEGWIHLLIWDVVVLVFLFFWGLAIVVEIQRSESVDYGRLMHLPVSARQIFFLNFAASHVCPPFLVAVSTATGLTLGLIIGRGAVMLLLIPLVLGFFFMVSAWTYCLRGWLSELFITKRRRNSALVLMVAAAMILLQVPNLFFSRVDVPYEGPLVTTLNAPSPEKTGAGYFSPETLLNPVIIKTHRWMPLLWVPSGAYYLAEGRVGPAILGALGAWLIGLIGLIRAYKSTMRFHLRSNSPSKILPVLAPSSRPARRSSYMEWRLPLVSSQTAALALASFRILFRAPEARIMLILPLLMTFLFGTVIFRQPSTDISRFLEPFLPAALTLMLLFGLIQISMNHFGFDRSGFRALMLVPMSRWEVLFAKNLSVFGVGVSLNLALLILLGTVREMSWDVILAGWFQFITGFLLLCILGNWASVLVPYRVASGSLKSNKMPLKVSVVIFACHTLFPISLIPIFIPSFTEVMLHHFGRAAGMPVSLLASLALMVMVILLYSLILRGQGRLLQRREGSVLATVTAALD